MGLNWRSIGSSCGFVWNLQVLQRRVIFDQLADLLRTLTPRRGVTTMDRRPWSCDWFPVLYLRLGAGGFAEAPKTTSEPARIPQYQGHTALPSDLCNPRYPSNWFLLPLVQWNQLSDLRFCFHQEPLNFHFYSSDFTFIFCFLSLWSSALLQNPIGARLLKFVPL